MKKLICFIAVILICGTALPGKDALNPKFPVVSGTIKVTKEWSITLPCEFNRRFEKGSLVLWKPAFTIWVNIWGNEGDKNPCDQLGPVREDKSVRAFDIVEVKDGGIYRYGYRIDETRSDDKTVYAFYGYVAGKSGYTQMAFYFDSKSDVDTAKAIWMGIKEM